MPGAKDIVLFDGDCAYCNGWVRWISARDRQGRFRFVPLMSEEGRMLRVQHNVSERVDSIVLVQDDHAFLRSDAAWRVLAGLPGWRSAAFLVRLVPRFLRNGAYDLIARNRHRLGLDDSCELPGHGTP